jgi:hypothetical protein
MTDALPNEEPASFVWLAHHHLKLGAVGLVFQFLNYAVPGLAGWVFTFVAATLITGFLVGASASIAHHGLTCGYCLDRITTDGDGEAKRRARTLRVVHRGGQRIEGAAVLVSVLAVPAAYITGNGWVGLLSVPLIPWFVWNVWTFQVHRRLQPWCPDCRNGGRGPREHSPTPRPVPEGVSQ